jgi:hypothetical protein
MLEIRDHSLRWWPRLLLLLHCRVHLLLRWEIVAEVVFCPDGETVVVGGSMVDAGMSGTGMRCLKLRRPLALDPVCTQPDLSDGTRRRRQLRGLTSKATTTGLLVAPLLLLPRIRCYVLIATSLDILLLVALLFAVSVARSWVIFRRFVKLFFLGTVWLQCVDFKNLGKAFSIFLMIVLFIS